MSQFDHCPYTATITDSERAAFWLAALGATTLPILTPIACLANLPGIPRAMVYLLDLAALQSEQQERLVTMLAAKFGLDEAEAWAAYERGVPILADDVMLGVNVPGVAYLLDDAAWDDLLEEFSDEEAGEL